MDNVIEIKTLSGFSCRIDRDRFDDWEYIEIQASNDFRTDPRFMTFVVDKVLDRADADRLKEMCRKPDGSVSGKKVSAIVLEIMKCVGDATKN